MSDLVDFVEWYRKQPFFSNALIKAEYLFELYEKEKEELIKSKRMTIGYFVGRIPIIKGKDGTMRLIRALLQAGDGYIDEIRIRFYCGKWGCTLRNCGDKTTKQFMEYKEKIISDKVDAYDTRP